MLSPSRHRWCGWPASYCTGDAGLPPLFPDARTLRLVGTTERWAWSTPYASDSSAPHWTAPIPNPAGDETFTASAAVPTRCGVRLFCGTSAGSLCVFDAAGALIATTPLAEGRIRFLAWTPVRGRPLLFAACGDRTIRVVEDTGRPCAAFETPGRPLSLHVVGTPGGLDILGGLQHDPRVYVWNLQRILQSRAAAPRLVLRGGRTPAFAGRFIPGAVRNWAVHGSWDGRLYLYDLTWAAGGIVKPVRVIEGRDPLYALASFGFKGLSLVLGGGESGAIHGWGFDPADGSCRLQMTFGELPSAVKSLRAARVGSEAAVVLFAGCRDGTTWELRTADPIGTPKPLGSLPLHVGGVDVLEGR